MKIYQKGNNIIAIMNGTKQIICPIKPTEQDLQVASIKLANLAECARINKAIKNEKLTIESFNKILFNTKEN